MKRRRRVVLRRDVPADLHAIAAYLDQHSIATSNRFISETFAAFKDLAMMPGKGSPKSFRSARLAGVRSWSVPRFRNFLILYRQIPDGIEVLAVTHGSRKLRAMLLQRA
jgi:plasmid stabilization system protein ParE